MPASGDIREDQDRRTRLRAAVNDVIAALDVLDGAPSASEAAQAKADIDRGVRRAMVHSGVRRVAPLSTEVDAA